MNFPLSTFLNKSYAFRAAILLVCVAALVAGASAQRTSKKSLWTAVFSPELAPAAADVDQCSQLTNPQCDWQNGNLNENNSNYFEGDSVAYRVVFDDVAPGSTGNMFIIEYDTTESGGQHTLDYLTTYNRTVTNANPCIVGNNTLCTVGSPSDTEAIPLDSQVTANCASCTQGGLLTMWNGTITSVGPIVNTGTYAAASTASIKVTFTAAGTGTPILAWGGHISTRVDWTVSAISLPGSPYHMRKGGGGGADRSLKVSAVTFPAKVTIIKTVTTNEVPPGTASTTAFPFTAINFSPTSFSLVDDDGGPGIDSITDANIRTFGTGAARITETLPGAPGDWSLADVTCDETSGGLPQTDNTVWTPGNLFVSLNIEEGEFITCTFHNTQLRPSAADATLSGRVLNGYGRGIKGVSVVVTDAMTGEARYTITNPFGYYSFSDLESGRFYFVRVSAKGYKFAESSKTFTLNDSLTDVDFVANP